MSWKPLAFLLLVFVCPACFLSRPYRSAVFDYTRDGQTVKLPLVVPKGFVKQERLDTAGAILHTFRYPGGALFYSAFVKDTNVQLQPINEAVHQPVPGPMGSLVYKGQDQQALFFREIRHGCLRFGYRNVTGEDEWRFDSATNFAAKQPVFASASGEANPFK